MLSVKCRVTSSLRLGSVAMLTTSVCILASPGSIWARCVMLSGAGVDAYPRLLGFDRDSQV